MDNLVIPELLEIYSAEEKAGTLNQIKINQTERKVGKYIIQDFDVRNETFEEWKLCHRKLVNKFEKKAKLVASANAEIEKVKRVWPSKKTYLGAPCKHGHNNEQGQALRNEGSKWCVECEKLSRLKTMARPDYKKKNAEYAQNYRDTHPESVDWQREYHATRRAEHPEIYKTYCARRELERIAKIGKDKKPD